MNVHATGPERWVFWYRIWCAYVVGGCVATVVLVIVMRRQDHADGWAATAALCCLLLWSAQLAPRLSNPDAFFRRTVNRRSVTFVTGALAFFLAAVWWSQSAVAAIMVVYALIYMSLPVRAAILVAAPVSFAPLVAALVTRTDVPVALGISLVAVVFNPAIGSTIALAIDRGEQLAVLLEELERSRADVERLSREAGSAAERARLAREIHDTLTQGFAGIAALAQAVDSELDTEPDAARRHVALIEATARENLVEARTMVETLTPPDLGGGSLADSVRRRCRRLTDETGIEVQVHVDSTVPQLDTGTEVVLLRAAQETLANVRRHSRAESVRVDLTRTRDGVRLSVADNGIGFDVDGVNGFGLAGLRSRAQEIGATVEVTTSPGAGTRVDIEVPA
ncbi:sensor histidine kinase [Nocardia sp. NPDC059240]|uniref:sensor histidine kinase n=1 Tax=Nocardia sp. NPDC059240 TaxID=3346786 RepID=UPI003678DD45